MITSLKMAIASPSCWISLSLKDYQHPVTVHSPVSPGNYSRVVHPPDPLNGAKTRLLDKHSETFRLNSSGSLWADRSGK